jgi:hypothetical protein
MPSDTGDHQLEAKVGHALDDLRSVAAALEQLGGQLRTDRARTISFAGRADSLVAELREEMTTALTSMRADVAATVAHLQAGGLGGRPGTGPAPGVPFDGPPDALVAGLREEMEVALTSMRNDVAATVVHLEAEVERRLGALTVPPDLVDRLEALERAQFAHGA